MAFFQRSVTKLHKLPQVARSNKRGVVSFARTKTSDLPRVFYGRLEVTDYSSAYGVIRNGLRRFNDLCLRSPNKAATFSSATVFFCADQSAQYVATKREGKEFDISRCFALTTFGALYYGGVVVRLYRFYDRVLGPKNIFAKALFDVTIHTPFGVIPTFYAWTHFFEGRTDSLTQRLQNDWADVSTASVAYWFPVQMSCFAFVPAVHRVAYVSFASFVHKTALSWWAHREAPIENASQPVTKQVVASPKILFIHETQGTASHSPTLGEKLIAHSQQSRGILSCFP